MNNLSAFAESLKSQSIEFLTDSPMSRHTSFKVGGNADIVALPKTQQEIGFIFTQAHKHSLPLTVIGNGSNLLVKDCGIRGVVIKTTSMNGDISLDGETLTCSAGTSLTRLCLFALENSLTGLEFAYGIPGSVGGAVFMNAGAYGGEVKDVLTSVSHITPDGEAGTIRAQDAQLGYRTSFYSKNPDYIITGASFRLQKGNKAEIKVKMDELMGKRKDKQPLEFPSAGSTFKRPEGHFAGALIEQCGLKGYTVGGAQVSEKHAGFIINRYNGTADDVLSLIEYVKNTVKTETGIELEPEVKIIP